MPEAAPNPEPEKKAAPRKKADPSARKLKAIKQKYRLDATVKLNAEGPGGRPLGIGPLMDETTFQKFAELDTTPTKQYLDWMLYQAGGGARAFENSRKRWGDDSTPRTPDNFFSTFFQEFPNASVRSEEVRQVAFQLKGLGIDSDQLMALAPDITAATHGVDWHEKYQAIVRILQSNQVAAGKEDRVASDLLTYKFKNWIKDQLATKVRDRVHATFILGRLIRGQPQDQAEQEWQTEIEPKRRHEYLYGDQDALKWNNFGFSRSWPGKENRYERVYTAAQQFISNRTVVERRNAQIENYNLRVKEKNKTLPPDQQLPLREPLAFNVDIGKVLVDKEGNLVYKGAYPVIESVTDMSKQLNELPMREKVSNDVRYAGPKNRVGSGEKLYSDANIDVVVPLTVAASIKSGHPDWDISDPDQINKLNAGSSAALSTWNRYASKNHNYPEFAESQAIPIFFHVKLPGMLKELTKILMITFIDDLVDLQPPYPATRWRLADGSEMKFTQMVDYFRRNLDGPTYYKLLRSISQAIKAIREWGKEFDPSFIVGDYIQYHRDREGKKRHLGENIQWRAAQIVEEVLS